MALRNRTIFGMHKIVFVLLKNDCKPPRFAFESPAQIAPTHRRVTIYTFRHTIWDQTVSIVDTPPLDDDSTLDVLKQWIAFRLAAKSQIRIDALLLLARDGHGVSAACARNYKALEQLLGDDVRGITVPIFNVQNKVSANRHDGDNKRRRTKKKKRKSERHVFRISVRIGARNCQML